MLLQRWVLPTTRNAPIRVEVSATAPESEHGDLIRMTFLRFRAAPRIYLTRACVKIAKYGAARSSQVQPGSFRSCHVWAGAALPSRRRPPVSACGQIAIKRGHVKGGIFPPFWPIRFPVVVWCGSGDRDATGPVAGASQLAKDGISVPLQSI